jgi:acyl carrier protein
MLNDELKQLVLRHARLDGDADAIGADTDLYALGLTSLACVNLMLALEDRYDVEFSDALLRRETFASVASIAQAIEKLRGS